jgi:molybdopterin/thiamine biosynthesis adenylyltransferase
MEAVNSDVCVTAISEFITEENCDSIIKGHDIMIDALDNIAARRIIEEAAQRLGVPLVHGAIGGWYGQVSVIMPGARLFDKIYGGSPDKEMKNKMGNLPFTAAATASVQAAEAVKILLGRGSPLTGKLLTLDLLSNEYEIFEI